MSLPNLVVALAAAAGSVVPRAVLAGGAIAFKPQEDVWANLWPALAALAVLALLAGAAAYAARRFGWRVSARAGRRLRIVERLPVSRQGALLLIECDGRVMLIGQAGASIRLLDRLEPLPPANPHAH